MFRRNPAVTGLGIRFYAGAVLRSKLGSPIGTLCVLDKTVRKLDETQRRQLRFLARSVEVALECHKGKKMKELRASGFLGPDGCAAGKNNGSLTTAFPLVLCLWRCVILSVLLFSWCLQPQRRRRRVQP